MGLGDCCPKPQVFALVCRQAHPHPPNIGYQRCSWCACTPSLSPFVACDAPRSHTTPHLAAPRHTTHTTTRTTPYHTHLHPMYVRVSVGSISSHSGVGLIWVYVCFGLWLPLHPNPCTFVCFCEIARRAPAARGAPLFSLLQPSHSESKMDIYGPWEISSSSFGLASRYVFNSYC